MAIYFERSSNIGENKERGRGRGCVFTCRKNTKDFARYNSLELKVTAKSAELEGQM